MNGRFSLRINNIWERRTHRVAIMFQFKEEKKMLEKCKFSTCSDVPTALYVCQKCLKTSYRK